MAGLPGFVSHGSGLHLGAGCQLSGSSWISQAPNLHLAMQLLKVIKEQAKAGFNLRKNGLSYMYVYADINNKRVSDYFLLHQYYL